MSVPAEWGTHSLSVPLRMFSNGIEIPRQVFMPQRRNAPMPSVRQEILA